MGGRHVLGDKVIMRSLFLDIAALVHSPLPTRKKKMLQIKDKIDDGAAPSNQDSGDKNRLNGTTFHTCAFPFHPSKTWPKKASPVLV